MQILALFYPLFFIGLRLLLRWFNDLWSDCSPPPAPPIIETLWFQDLSEQIPGSWVVADVYLESDVLSDVLDDVA
jgi:hypothetical protein